MFCHGLPTLQTQNLTHLKKEKRKKRLSRAKKVAAQGGGSTILLQLNKEINSLMDKEERIWRQRSHALYIKDKDRNTHFLHCRAT